MSESQLPDDSEKSKTKTIILFVLT